MLSCWAQHMIGNGESDEAKKVATKTLESAMGLGAKFEQVVAHSVLGQIAFSQGHLDEALNYYEKGMALAPEEWRARSGVVHVHILRGNLEQLSQVLQGGDESTGARALAYHHVLAMKTFGESPFPGDILQQLRDRNMTNWTEPGPKGMAVATLAAAAAQGLIDDDPRDLYKQSLVMDLGSTWNLLVPHQLILGDLASVIGMQHESEQHYLRFLKESRDSKLMVRVAEGCVSYSEFLLDRNGPGDREKAIELQDEAISIATELGMKPLLERVLAKREILKA